MKVYEFDPISRLFTRAVEVGDRTLEEALALSPAFVDVPPPDDNAAWDGERWVAGTRQTETVEMLDEAPALKVETMHTSAPEISELARRVAELEAQVAELRADQEV